MLKIKVFLKTSFIGGLVVVLPVAILLALLTWIFNKISVVIDPIVKLVISHTEVREFVAAFLVLLVIVFGCFAIGVFVKTRAGFLLHEVVEKRFLKKITGYTLVKETVARVLGSEKPLFSGTALFFPFGKGGAAKLGFITGHFPDEKLFVLFEPTAPNPTSGLLYILKDELVVQIPFLSTEETMRIILSCGGGVDQNLTKNLARYIR